LIFEKLKPKGTVLINNVQGNKMYVNTEDKSMVPQLLLDRVWEKYKTELFKKIITKGMVVVDVGAGIGYYSLIAAKLVGRNGIVYAFEPEPNSYELLCKNIEVNGYTNVIPIQKAVSDKKGKAKLYFEKERIVNPSFCKENVLAASKHKVLEKGRFVEIDTIKLDEFFEKTVRNNKVDVIKVDTEGAEGLVVDGGEEILKSNNLKMFIEFWPDGLAKLGTDPLRMVHKLKEYGFKAKLINETDQSADQIEIVEFYRKMTPGQGFDLLLEK
jgi:FkbM family methyltransferase